MSNVDLQKISQPTKIIEVYYTYTPQEQAERDNLIRSIELIKADFHERIEPYLKRLVQIQGMPHIVVLPRAEGDGR